MIHDDCARGAYFFAFFASNTSISVYFFGYLRESAEYLLQSAKWTDKIMEHFWLISQSNENG